MKINAQIRLQSQAPDSQLIAAADWLNSYVTRSWDLLDSTKNIEWVTSHLAPLKTAVPLTPVTKKLYRVIPSKIPLIVGQELALTGTRLTSFTYGSGKDFWDSLSDSVGADSEEYCYVVQVMQPIVEVFNTRWLFGPVLAYIKANYKGARILRNLLENAPYVWQKEVVGYAASSELHTKVVCLL